MLDLLSKTSYYMVCVAVGEGNALRFDSDALEAAGCRS